MKKELYITPSAEIIEIAPHDNIVTTSTPPEPGENETPITPFVIRYTSNG